MKTLYLTNSSANIAVDMDTDEVSSLQNLDRYNIRNIYYAEEPMHVVYNGVATDGTETKEEVDAKKGDIIVVFYNDRFNKKVLTTIKNKAWVENIKNRQKIEQKEREEWAKKKCDNNLADAPCCDCCEAAC